MNAHRWCGDRSWRLRWLPGNKQRSGKTLPFLKSSCPGLCRDRGLIGRSGRPYGGEELVHLRLQALVLVRQELRRRKYLGRSRPGVARAAVDVGNGGRDLGGADRRLLDAAGDFLSRGAL